MEKWKRIQNKYKHNTHRYNSFTWKVSHSGMTVVFQSDFMFKKKKAHGHRKLIKKQ